MNGPTSPCWTRPSSFSFIPQGLSGLTGVYAKPPLTAARPIRPVNKERNYENVLQVDLRINHIRFNRFCHVGINRARPADTLHLPDEGDVLIGDGLVHPEEDLPVPWVDPGLGDGDGEAALGLPTIPQVMQPDLHPLPQPTQITYWTFCAAMSMTDRSHGGMDPLRGWSNWWYHS